MLNKQLILRLFEGFSIQRWNDLVRPFELVEMDKAAERMVAAYIIGKYEEARGNKVDWNWIIYASIFELLKKIALCDIKSPVQQMIKRKFPKEYIKLNEWVLKQFKDIVDDNELYSEFTIYIGRTAGNFAMPENLKLSARILRAAHKFSSLRELQMIECVNEEERITKMVEDRNDWCISRQRTWGVPIPIFYCTECDKEYVTEESLKKVQDIVREKGTNAWFDMSAEELMPEGAQCSCGCKEFRKETDIMDVWFDSGTTHFAVLEEKGLWPATMYLEGNDQYRGWFQSSLLTSIAVKGESPYKIILTHGWTVDGQGKKMSKSLGNGISPQEVIKEYGADILRLWVLSSDYQSDVSLSKDILKQITEVYRKIRNTARYILGNTSDFNPDTDMVEYKDLEEIDKYALLKLNDLVKKCTESYDRYDFHEAYQAINVFCVTDMSSFYLDIIKDRLYTSKVDSVERRAAQTTMYIILEALVKILA